MPATHVALLRGINVGKARRIAMADLRALVEVLGGKLVTALDRALKDGVTSRNRATMLKLAALLGA